MKEHAARPPLDTIFCFEDELRREGHIRLRIYEHQGKAVVIATDLDKGPSITNAAAIIATQVVAHFGLDPERLIWVEHYPREDIRGGISSGGEEYDLVTFTWTGEQFVHPRWKYSTQSAVEALLGVRL